jgi:hypothetical protein
MKKKILWVNLALAGLIAAAGLRVRDEWKAQQQREQALSTRAVKPSAVPAAPVPAPPAAVPAASYADIANKTLFSKDRNPTVVIDAPPPPVKKMPPLPLLHGILGLPSGTLALMSLDGKSGSKGVAVGEKIGEFELAAVDRDDISFKWEDQTITKSVSEMIYRAAELSPAQPAASGGSASGPAPVNAPPQGGIGKPAENAGTDGYKNCSPGDTSPEGTVADGYRKVMPVTPFGKNCHWEPVK